jgi:hypothetical protein
MDSIGGIKMYLTNFKGEVDLSTVEEGEARDLLYKRVAKTIEKHSLLKDSVSFEKDTGVLYFNGPIENSEDIVEKFFLYICSQVIIPEEFVIEAQGEDSKDRWDIIIRPDGVYVQDYDLVKGELTKYTGE